LNTQTGQVDPTRCPLCGQPNACAMAGGCEGANDSPCWCVTATFTPELMQRIPVQAQGKACICQTCAQGTSTDR
jgi:hypothetical protein